MPTKVRDVLRIRAHYFVYDANNDTMKRVWIKDFKHLSMAIGSCTAYLFSEGIEDAVIEYVERLTGETVCRSIMTLQNQITTKWE